MTRAEYNAARAASRKVGATKTGTKPGVKRKAKYHTSGKTPRRYGKFMDAPSGYKHNGRPSYGFNL